MSSNEKGKENNPAVDRALNILEYLIVSKSSTIKEISEYLNIPLVSASRLVKTLLNRGYLKQKKGSPASYSLGIKLLNFSHIVYEQIDLCRIAEKHMRVISDATDQTSQLAIMQQGSVMYINQVLPRKPVSIIAPLHIPLPLNVSACGKVLCAWLPVKDQYTCLDAADLVKATSKSIIDKKEFLDVMKTVKSLGYALDDEEFAKGIGCIAAPILDHSGKIIAAVGITGHIEPYKNEETFSMICKTVIAAAQNISQEIGYALEQ